MKEETRQKAAVRYIISLERLLRASDLSGKHKDSTLRTLFPVLGTPCAWQSWSRDLLSTAQSGNTYVTDAACRVGGETGT